MNRSSASFLTMVLPAYGLAQSVPDMLERTLPGVFTVAINEITPTKIAMGAASGTDRFNKAYDRALDLSDAKGSGSGFLIQRGGKMLVVTNAHVVEMAEPSDSINQTRYKLSIFGGNSFYNIALLEFVEPAKPGPELTPLSFRQDDLRGGEYVYALGNPLGEYPYSATQGIFGGRNRLLSGLTGRIGYLQHSAGIIWGNSSGPLVDSSGQVAGINTRIDIEENGQAFLIAQLNFALESSGAQRVIDGLLQNKGRLNRAYLGLELTQTLTVNKFRRSVATEALIDSVVPNSPAAVLAKYTGYRVDRIGTHAIRDLDEAMEAIEAIKHDETVEFEVSKNGAAETVSLKAGQLTEQNYAALTNYLMSSRSNYEIVQQNGQVFLQQQRQPQARVTSSMEMYQVNAAQRTSLPSAPQVLGIVAVGIVLQRRGDGERAEPDLYRINTITDLGVTLRLFLRAGGADLLVVPPNSDEPTVLRWTLSTESDVAVRMLIA
jgi:S1-C subfamily serine protease